MRKWNFLVLMLFFAMSFAQLHANEKSTYDFSWLDPDKEVYVLQNRKFRKNKRLFFNIGGGTTVSGAFVDSNHIQGRVGYFFKEDYGLTVLYSKNNGDDNTTADSVRSVQGVPFRRIVQDYQALLFTWSPFYTKINTFNKIIYTDWTFGVGLAKLNEENNREELDTSGVASKDVIKSESHTGLIWDLGIKFFLTQNFTADVNITSVMFEAEKATPGATDKTRYTHTDLTIGIGYFF